MRLFPRLFERPPAPEALESWTLEVQIHPGDIRKRVRYLFLSRTQVTLLSLLALSYLFLLALAAAVAPGVVGGILNSQEYHSLAAERARQGERLQALVERMGEVAERAEGLHQRMDKVFLAYGVPRSAAGRARASFTAEPVPESIYSRTVQQGNRLRARTGERLAVLDASVAEVRRFEREHPDQVRTTPSLSPLRGDFVLTSSFRTRRSPFTDEIDFHAGLDLAAPVGTTIHAPADGVVAFAGQVPMGRSAVWWRFGNLVVLRHGDRFVTLYGHCEEIRVRPGQRVSRGDVIATVGNTGWSTSPHVHYEVRRREADGELRPVDPVVHILDHRWPNEDRLLLRARSGPPRGGYEPLPPGFAK